MGLERVYRVLLLPSNDAEVVFDHVQGTVAGEGRSRRHRPYTYMYCQ